MHSTSVYQGLLSVWRIRAGLMVIPVLLSACALHYHDRATGTEHIWGLGHLSMKAQSTPEGHVVLVKGLETLGIVAGLGQDDSYFQTGWSRRQRIELLWPDASIHLEGPSADFMGLRIGTSPTMRPQQ